VIRASCISIAVVGSIERCLERLKMELRRWREEKEFGGERRLCTSATATVELLSAWTDIKVVDFTIVAGDLRSTESGPECPFYCSCRSSSLYRFKTASQADRTHRTGMILRDQG